MTPTIALPEAEAAFVGALLFQGRRAAEALLLNVNDDDLADPRHRAVLRAVRAVVQAGGRPDPVTVLGELRRSGEVSAMTNDRSAGTFVADLLAAVPVPESAGYYAQIVLEHAWRRRVQEAGERLQQAAGTLGQDDLHELVAAEFAAVTAALSRAGGQP